MNKAELIDAVASETGANRSAASDAVDAVLSSIQKSLVNGDKVTLPGFGTFEVRSRAARQGRNPQTGETIQVQASKAPAFKAGAGLKNAVNGR
ncbi:MAG TPA: HU family DNA-binding protein [Acidimicrobiia bacterium]|jgi:DNA-binding protein HU-beta|nr:HU family DNA-binding protein [Acidimicrobiia bacterium]